MSRQIKLIFFVVLVVSSATVSASDDPQAIADFRLCAGCHGLVGEGNAEVRAPALAGREAWYLARQIASFQKGWRGGDANDTDAYQMAQMTQALASEQRIEALANYIAGLSPDTARLDSGPGDAAAGEALYAPCAACHGADARGNKALNAPALHRQEAWYQISQLNKFRNESRGAHPDDTWGQQMAPMAATLADEQAIADVVAYILSLQE